MSGSLLAGSAPAQTITFSQIPAGIQVPGNYTEIQADYSSIGLLTYPARFLALCPVPTPYGSLQPGVPVQVFTPQQADVLFGPGTIGSAICKAFLAANPFVPFWVLGVAAPSGAAAATWTIPVSFGPPLVGTPAPLALYIGSVQIPVTVTPGVDTATTIASNLLAAINATPDLPVTASASAATLTLTARDKGALGNALPVAFAINSGDVIPGGQTNGTNNLLVPVTNNNTGAGLHLAGAALGTYVPSTWFTHIYCPWTDSTNTGALTAELTRRWGAMTKLDARAFGFYSASNLTNLTSIAGGGAVNSAFLSIAGLQNGPTAPWVVGATYAAVAVQALLADPARQLKTLLLPGVKAPATVDILTEAEEQEVVTNGLALLQPQNDGTVQILRAATTYQQAPGGIPDTTWMDITTAEVLSRIRYDWNSYLGLVYPRPKLAADGTLAAEYDRAIATPRRLQSSWSARCTLYEKLGWIQNSAATAAASKFVLDPNNPNQIDTQLQLLLINNLMIVANQIIFSLNAAGIDQSAS